MNQSEWLITYELQYISLMAYVCYSCKSTSTGARHQTFSGIATRGEHSNFQSDEWNERVIEASPDHIHKYWIRFSMRLDQDRRTEGELSGELHPEAFNWARE